ncbi:MAG: hypothetical protein ACE5E9_00105 [Nitrospinaceae bacterium]
MKAIQIYRVLLFSVLFLVVNATFSMAEDEASGGGDSSQKELKNLKKEISKLKKSYRQLNKRMIRKPRTDFDLPKLQIRGFGHLQYDYKATKTISRNGFSNNFTNGGVDLFITSRIASKLSFLNETVFEFGEDGANVLDVERVLLKYEATNWFNVSLGRGHTALGYWNQRFHHGRWLYTTVDRPVLYSFEDDGGILPVHFVGLEFSGNLDSGIGGLTYVANVANGRGRITDEVQLTEDDNDSKMLSFMFSFEPDFLPGFGFGANIIGDTIPNNPGLGRPIEVDERIYGTHVFYIDEKIELIGEFQFIEHSTATVKTHSGGYVQFAYTFFNKYKPYYRYDVIDIDSADSFFAETGAEDTVQHTLGVRIEWFPFAALKLEYRNKDSDSISSDEATAQIAFAF